MAKVEAAVILGPMRLPFLVLTPACLLVAIAMAYRAGGGVQPLHLVLVVIGGLAAHICVNSFNEYFDFKSGLDLITEPTPFSGGSKTLPTHPDQAPVALAVALSSLVVTVAVGGYFLAVRGLGLLPVGLCGVLLLVVYTVWFTRNPLGCLVAPGLGFGPLMVLGAHYALTGVYGWTALVASLVPFFLVNNLLLLNQFPDVEADRQVGRRHLPIAFGIAAGVRVYIAFLICAYLVIVVGWLTNLWPATALLGLATVAVAIPTVRDIMRHATTIPALIPALGKNVLIIIVTPLLFAVGIFVG